MPADDDPTHLTRARLDALGANLLLGISTDEDRESVLALAERSAGIGVWDVDLASGMARGTAQFFRIMGLEPTNDPVPMDVMRARRHPEDREKVVEGFRRAVESGADSYEMEYRIIRPDGEVRWIFGRGRVLRDARGAPVRYSGVDIDVTERKQAETALAEREAMLASAQRLAHIGSWEIDLESNTLRWTDETFRIFGYQPREVEVSRELFSDHVHPEDRAAVAASMADALRDHRPYQVEHRIVRRDGSVRFVHEWADILVDETGRPRKLRGTCQDITERKEAETALAESEARLALAQEAAGIGIWDWDIASGALRWSAENYRLHGIEAAADRLDYRTWQSAIHPEDRAAADVAVWTAIEKSEPYEAEYRVLLPDGRVRWLVDRGKVILDAAGDPARMIGVSYDVTERREAVDALARLNLELEARIEERTAELVQLQKLEALGQLTGGIAHDFNNLLAVVLGSLRLLRKRFDHEPSALRLIDAAVQGAERGAGLTQRLLAFARRQELASGAVDLATLVRGMSELLGRSLGPIVRIALDLPDQLPLARVDANQLELAMLNLAVNARDAMPLGGTLMIAARTDTAGVDDPTGLAPGTYVVLSVMDTGVGMDAATLARATEPFFTTKGVGKGTGLGLAMVHGLAAQSGGALRLTSQPGKGTTAAIWLPVAEDVLRAAELTGDQATAIRAHPPLTVLVVDDDALVLAGTAAMLEDLGHAVIEANSASAALEKLRAGVAVDLIVTDQVMPGITGIELADKIRVELPGVPLLLATGYAELPGNVDPTLPQITKPFGQEALAAAIAKLVSAPGAAAKIVRLKPR